MRPEMQSINTARVFHITAKYGEKVFIWGGLGSLSRTLNASFVQCLDMFSPVSDTQNTFECKGEVPGFGLGYTAQIIGDKLYLFTSGGPAMLEPLGVFSLDLGTLVWKREEVSGVAPVPVAASASWVRRDKIYLFAGYGSLPRNLDPKQSQIEFTSLALGAMNNQLVYLNTSTMSWEWPQCSGSKPPQARSHHKAIVDKDYVLIYGGRTNSCVLNSLHALHLPTHTWKELRIEGAYEVADVPKARCCPSLTLTKAGRAILYGGHTSFNATASFSECWLLSWSIDGNGGISDVKCSQWKKAEMWPQSEHEAHYIQETAKIYCIGGNNVYTEDISILVSPHSLYEASVDKITKAWSKFNSERWFLLSSV